MTAPDPAGSPAQAQAEALFQQLDALDAEIARLQHLRPYLHAAWNAADAHTMMQSPGSERTAALHLSRLSFVRSHRYETESEQILRQGWVSSPRLLAQQQPAQAPAGAEEDFRADIQEAAQRVRVMHEKAALWDALLGAARLRPLGWAGTPGNDADPVTHFGMEFWTRYPGYDHTETNTRGRQLLTSFARAAALADAEQGGGAEGAG